MHEWAHNQLRKSKKYSYEFKRDNRLRINNYTSGYVSAVGTIIKNNLPSNKSFNNYSFIDYRRRKHMHEWTPIIDPKGNVISENLKELNGSLREATCVEINNTEISFTIVVQPSTTKTGIIFTDYYCPDKITFDENKKFKSEIGIQIIAIKSRCEPYKQTAINE